MDFLEDKDIGKFIFNTLLPLVIIFLPYVIKKDDKNKKIKKTNKKLTPREKEIKQRLEEQKKREKIKEDKQIQQKKKKIFEENKKVIENKKILATNEKNKTTPKVVQEDTTKLDRLIQQNEIKNIKTSKVEEKEVLSNTEFDLKTAFIYSEILQKPLSLRK